jgi:mxaJ protein
MSSLCRKNLNRRLIAAGMAVFCLTAGTAAGRDLKVCADPNNLPFSNDRLEGFENSIADLLARDLGASVTYTWWAQRRGFARNTLNAGLCDVVVGVPVGIEQMATTQPYYRSGYVFVTRAADGPPVASLDDPVLHTVLIGVQMIGDDFSNTPPALRKVDVAVVWGPLAGYFAARQSVPLRLSPVPPDEGGPIQPMRFDMAMGVRRDDPDLRRELDEALGRNRAAIDSILADYGVPRFDLPKSQSSRTEGNGG